MKWIKIKPQSWVRIVRKLRECMRANRALNRQIQEYNDQWAK